MSPVRHCVNCKYCKNEGSPRFAHCSHPLTQTRTSGSAFARVAGFHETESPYCITERNGLLWLNKCGMRGKLWEAKL